MVFEASPPKQKPTTTYAPPARVESESLKAESDKFMERVRQQNEAFLNKTQAEKSPTVNSPPKEAPANTTLLKEQVPSLAER